MSRETINGSTISSLIEKVKQGDLSTRNIIINYYKAKTKKIASEYFDLGLEKEDIISSAYEGLITGINKLSTISSNTNSKKYIYFNIRISIEKNIAVEYGIPYKEEKNRNIKINLLIKVLKAKKELKHKLHHIPTSAEISDYINANRKSVEDVIRLINFKNSQDKNRVSYFEITKKKNNIDIESEYIDREILQIEKLTKIEKEILYLRYYENMTLKEISIIIKIHHSYVHQIIKNALFKIRRINQIENEKRKKLKRIR